MAARDRLAESLSARAAPSTRDALAALADALREAHPGEAEGVLRGRLAARATLEEHGRFAAPGDPPSVLEAERRARAHAELAARAPGELTDGVDARWARRPADRAEVIDIWRRWAARRRGERLFVYAHVPFCRTRCGFCQFESVIGAREAAVEATLAATLEEAAALAPALAGARADAVTIGGGTPSELDPSQLARLLAALEALAPRRDGAYFSVELNPDSTTAGKLEVLAAGGVNRVSFGVQSLHAPTLRAVARGYQTTAMVEDALRAAREAGGLAAGGLKVAVDLIASLPEETAASFEDGAARVLALGPDQVVLYAYQPVRRGGRAMDPGPLPFAEAASIFASRAEAAGYQRVPHTGSSVIVERAGARRFDVRYVQHAREPTSVLGVGPFAESHAFGVATYVAGAELGAAEAYRVSERSEVQELAAYVGRRLSAAMPIEEAEVTRVFGASLEASAPETVGWLLERGSLARVEGGLAARGDRAAATGAAWSFLDPDTLAALRRRLGGGLPARRALAALSDPAPIAARAGRALARAVDAVPVAIDGREGIRLALAPDELDHEAAAALFPWAPALAELAGHGLLGGASAVVLAASVALEVRLAAPCVDLLRGLVDPRLVPRDDWWARVAAVRVDGGGRLALRWDVDPATSPLLRAVRRALPPPLADALADAALRYERGPDGEALIAAPRDPSALARVLPRRPGPESGGRVRALRLPLTGARPRLEALSTERALPKPLHVASP